VRRDADDSTVSQFTVAADGVATVDSSELDLEQTVDAVLAVVAQLTTTAGHADEAGTGRTGA
jgi:cytidylate kinase